ncbi:TetR family transcriptional regulator [Litoribrevibacter albus]|uniref:DNA-binding transcriptional regulator FabR n=1 Tax=Litoribrevibacter albus TaxID=1473156 RepID=A0AA37SC82_9GAMM|nr:TetR family transcriptional regulator [Litoribrevibacter albus]GLQ32709.1 DNA-binding transcriptional regulator FabR [Litoribrevibacter albus]
MSREERKRQTRKSLMDSALGLIEQGQHFSNISLREVAKNAGVVPTSFYRHFQDMEELGLNLIDEFSVLLRRVRSELLATKETLTLSALLTTYVDTLDANTALFTFIQQCRTSEHLEIRNAIRQELQGMSGELASELRVSYPSVSRQSLTQLSQVAVHFLMDAMVDALDQRAQGADQSRVVERLVEQVGLLGGLLR